MDLRLQGKRALVTGSSIGLGEAIARALAAEGVAVAIHGRQPKRTYAVAADIEAHGGRVAVVHGDLTVEGEAQNIADSAIEQLGGIDILVNNAGGTGEKLLWEDTPIRAWTESYERNVLAAVRLISRLLLPMRQSGWGRIVNVSSVAGVMPQPTGPDYSASKAAINNLSLSLTKALGASGVTVNTVSPGMILTPKLEEVFRQMATTNGWVASDASWEEIERAFLKVSQVPLGRIGRVDEVAHAVTNEAQAKAAFEAAITSFGGLDVLVNNAGYGYVCPVEDTSLADFRAQIETNLFGVIIMTKAVLPYFRERRAGHIIQVTSIAGRIGPAGRAPYAAAKFGVEGFSESLFKEIGPLGIKVTIIEPGGFRTDFAGSSTQLSEGRPEYDSTVGAAIRFQRSYNGRQPGDPAKAAAALLHVASLSEPPLRLLLGSDSYAATEKSALDKIESDRNWKDLSLSTDYASDDTHV